MKVEFQVSGGVGFFPGLAAPRTVDADALPAAERDALHAAVDAAGFFSLPRRLAAPKGAADYRTYQITIEDRGRRHTISVPEPIANPLLQKLIDTLSRLTRP